MTSTWVLKFRSEIHGKERRTPECKNPKVLDSILKADISILVSRQTASFLLPIFLSCVLSIFISNGLRAYSLQILVTDLSTCWLLVTFDFFPWLCLLIVGLCFKKTHQRYSVIYLTTVTQCKQASSLLVSTPSTAIFWQISGHQFQCILLMTL